MGFKIRLKCLLEFNLPYVIRHIWWSLKWRYNHQGNDLWTMFLDGIKKIQAVNKENIYAGINVCQLKAQTHSNKPALLSDHIAYNLF